MIRRTLATFVAAALLFTTSAWAKSTFIARPGSQDMFGIVVPESPLRFTYFDSDGKAHFKGRIKLSGTYYYGDANETDGKLYFKLDRETKVRLPHFKGYHVPDLIYFSNDAAFIETVLPEKQFETPREIAKYITGRVQIIVDNLETGVECDAPFINVRFVSVALAPLRFAAADLPDEGC